MVLIGAALAQAPTYDPNQAMDSLWYCKAAYCLAADIQTWNCSMCSYHNGFTNVNVYEHEAFDGQGYTGYNPDTNMIVVAFRGSSNIPNWFADLDFVFTTYPNTECSGCEVHRGFLQSYQSMSSNIISDVQSLVSQYSSAAVLVTGHSLGAALTVLAIVDLVQAASPGGGFILYNFGCPRVGNPAFVAWAASVIPGAQGFRLTHERDPVPHVPPLDFGFLHLPQEVWYQSDTTGGYTLCNDSATAEDPNCSDSEIPADVSNHLLYLGLYTGCDTSSRQVVPKRKRSPKSVP